MNELTHTRPAFHLEFTTLAAFAAFVALIRGDDLDDAKLAELAGKLKAATASLQAAEDAAP